MPTRTKNAKDPRGELLRALRSIFRKKNGDVVSQSAFYKALHRIARERAPFISHAMQKKVLNPFVPDPGTGEDRDLKRYLERLEPGQSAPKESE